MKDWVCFYIEYTIKYGTIRKSQNVDIRERYVVVTEVRS